MSRYHGQLWTVIGGVVALLFLAPGGAAAQDPLETASVAPGAAATATATASDKGAANSTNKTDAKAKEEPKPEFIVKSPVEWRKILTMTQFAVTRQKATEPAFTGKYASGHFRGTFVCVCCDADHVTSELFSSRAKFESGTGWPSFYQAFNNKAIQTAWDYSDGEPRVEVMCRRCGAHLGHVFDDGPPPTGLRFCINSAAIKLIAPGLEASSKNAVSKTSSRSKAKAKPKTSAKSAPKRSRSDGTTAPADSASAPAADNGDSGRAPRTSGL